MMIVSNLISEHQTIVLHANMKLLNFIQIVELHIAIFMHKVFHKLLPYNLQRYFTTTFNEYGTETCSTNPMYIQQRNIVYLPLE